jgi:hypothetical protein
MNPMVLLRVLGLLLVARLVARFVAAVVRELRAPAAASGAAGRGGEMVRDLVCNTFVPRERALRALVRGQEAHFCSPACRDRALAPQP